MQTTQMILLLRVSIGFLVVIMLGLIGAYFYVSNKKSNENDSKNEMIKDKDSGEEEKKKIQNYGRFQGELTKESIYEFLEFDEVKDGMIIRKNRTQYVMVLQCNGVNYDLMSEPEKVAVEEGFVQFLNTLRFPIQIYVQSRTLNLREIISEYGERISNIQNDLQKIEIKMAEAKRKNDRETIDRLEFDKRRKRSVLEYGMDITDYIDRMSQNKNILQQKTYLIVSYYSAEIGGNIENYSKDELDSMCFTELYTRSQNIASAIGACQVSTSILDSEELSELLYIAYNRDESEMLQFARALDSQYDSLYSTGKDVYEKQKEMIDEQIGFDAVEIATDSLIKADRMKKQLEWGSSERKEKVKARAKELLEEYEDRLDDEVFEMALKNIDKLTEERYSQFEEEKPKATQDETTSSNKKVIKRRA